MEVALRRSDDHVALPAAPRRPRLLLQEAAAAMSGVGARNNNRRQQRHRGFAPAAAPPPDDVHDIYNYILHGDDDDDDDDFDEEEVVDELEEHHRGGSSRSGGVGGGAANHAILVGGGDCSEGGDHDDEDDDDDDDLYSMLLRKGKLPIAETAPAAAAGAGAGVGRSNGTRRGNRTRQYRRQNGVRRQQQQQQQQQMQMKIHRQQQGSDESEGANVDDEDDDLYTLLVKKGKIPAPSSSREPPLDASLTVLDLERSSKDAAASARKAHSQHEDSVTASCTESCGTTATTATAWTLQVDGPETYEGHFAAASETTSSTSNCTSTSGGGSQQQNQKHNGGKQQRQQEQRQQNPPPCRKKRLHHTKSPCGNQSLYALMREANAAAAAAKKKGSGSNGNGDDAQSSLIARQHYLRQLQLRGADDSPSTALRKVIEDDELHYEKSPEDSSNSNSYSNNGAAKELNALLPAPELGSSSDARCCADSAEEGRGRNGRRAVHFGHATVREYRVVLDTSALGGYGLHGPGTCAYPLTLDWSYNTEYVRSAPAYSCNSYFANAPMEPMSQFDRQWRLAVLNDVTLERVRIEQERALKDAAKVITGRINQLLEAAAGAAASEGKEGAVKAPANSIFDYRTPSDWSESPPFPASDRRPRLPVPSEKALVVEWKRNASGARKVESEGGREEGAEGGGDDDEESVTSSEASLSLDDLLELDDVSLEEFKTVPMLDSVAAVMGDSRGPGENEWGFDQEVPSTTEAEAEAEASHGEQSLAFKELLQQSVDDFHRFDQEEADRGLLVVENQGNDDWQPEPMLDLTQAISTSRNEAPTQVHQDVKEQKASSSKIATISSPRKKIQQDLQCMLGSAKQAFVEKMGLSSSSVEDDAGSHGSSNRKAPARKKISGRRRLLRHKATLHLVGYDHHHQQHDDDNASNDGAAEAVENENKAKELTPNSKPKNILNNLMDSWRGRS